LLFVAVVALIKTIDVTTVGKVFQNADELRLKCTAG
jgi:hypothetical protein